MNKWKFIQPQGTLKHVCRLKFWESSVVQYYKELFQLMKQAFEHKRKLSPVPQQSVLIVAGRRREA